MAPHKESDSTKTTGSMPTNNPDSQKTAEISETVSGKKPDETGDDSKKTDGKSTDTDKSLQTTEETEKKPAGTDGTATETEKDKVKLKSLSDSSVSGESTTPCSEPPSKPTLGLDKEKV